MIQLCISYRYIVCFFCVFSVPSASLQYLTRSPPSHGIVPILHHYAYHRHYHRERERGETLYQHITFAITIHCTQEGWFPWPWQGVGGRDWEAKMLITLLILWFNVCLVLASSSWQSCWLKILQIPWNHMKSASETDSSPILLKSTPHCTSPPFGPPQHPRSASQWTRLWSDTRGDPE